MAVRGLVVSPALRSVRGGRAAATKAAEESRIFRDLRTPERRDYSAAISSSANPDVFTSVAPSIRRAKS
jgi:hypothetical protein